MSLISGRLWLTGILSLLLLAGCQAAGPTAAQPHKLLADDVGRLYPTAVSKVVHADATAALVGALAEAQAQGLNVSIAGKGHSQGGHTFYPDAVVLDMKDYDAIVALDVERRLLRVQSGATWEEVQDYINPHGLAIKVMQSSNIFTVGGSLSANVHGRDPRYGPLISTVRSLRLLQPDGTILDLSRDQHAELFSLVIGGYGLFGVILDVDLELTDNVTYEKHSELLHYSDYPAWFARNVRDNPDVGLHYGRLSIVPGAPLLQEMSVSTYVASSRHADQALASTVNQLYPSQQQIEAAYPRIQTFFARKASYDPGLLFRNRFHAAYSASE